MNLGQIQNNTQETESINTVDSSLEQSNESNIHYELVNTNGTSVVISEQVARELASSNGKNDRLIGISQYVNIPTESFNEALSMLQPVLREPRMGILNILNLFR